MDVMKIANWFRVRNYSDMQVDESIDELTQLKLMKLLYFSQGVFLAAYHKRLFDDPILAWNYGPVVKQVHDKYVGKRGIVNDNVPITNADLSDYENISSDEEASAVLEAVYRAYGSMSSSDLVNITHSQTPLKTTPQSGEISTDKIEKYFKDHVVTYG